MLSRNHPLRICGGLAIRLYRYSFNRLRIGRMRRAGATIEGTSYIDPRCKLLHHRNISIGDKCCIGKAELYALDKIEIGSRTLIGDRVYLCTGSHDLYFEGVPPDYKTDPDWSRSVDCNRRHHLARRQHRRWGGGGCFLGGHKGCSRRRGSSRKSGTDNPHRPPRVRI